MFYPCSCSPQWLLTHLDLNDLDVVKGLYMERNHAHFFKLSLTQIEQEGELVYVPTYIPLCPVSCCIESVLRNQGIIED